MAHNADQWLESLRQRYQQRSPQQAHAEHLAGALLLDVREADELQGGLAEGAVHVPRSMLELRISQFAPDPQRPLRLLCESGARSLLACANLDALGYRDLASVSGGMQAWKTAALPITRSSTLDVYQRQRYLRHIQLPEVGEAGQQRISNGRVLVVGAGGLGCPAAQYLAAAGVGHLGIIDDDRVELSNLQRQVLHAEARLGMPKADSAALSLRALNPSIVVEPMLARLNDDNVDAVLEGYDIVIDGSDNFQTRYLLNEACLRQGKPLVYGAVQGFSGQVSVFWPAGAAGPWPCYRCLFPDPPPAQFAPNCSEAGVLGVVPGVVGTLQASEAIKLLLGLRGVLLGSLLQLDLQDAGFRRLTLSADPQCPSCGPPQHRRPPVFEAPACSLRG